MKKIILGMTLMAAAGTFCSCSGFLDEEPELSQSNELTLAKYDGLNSAGAALYTFLQSSYWYDGEFILQSELRGGNAKNPVSLPGSGRYRGDTQWNYTAESTSSLWSYAYYTITWADNILNNIEGKSEAGVTEQDWNNLKAEALFFRALCHFDLVITYAQPYSQGRDNLGVPVVLVTENGQPARNTVGEVYDQIVTDLKDAESLMADNYTRPGVSDPTAVVSKPAVQALLSRVYLYMGEWQNAADYATKVINSGKYRLLSGSNYLNMWSATVYPANTEIIFGVFGSKKNSYWDESGWTHLPWILDPAGSADVCATTDLVDLYDADDIRLQLFTKNENDNMVAKYSGKEGSSPKETNIPILRLAEMYLNRAEAIVHGASVSGVTAQSDLQVVASNRGVVAPQPSETSVFNERRKELFFEGHIVYDLARCKRDLARTDFDGVINKDIKAGDYKWAMPIPSRECNANPNMTQNPGY